MPSGTLGQLMAATAERVDALQPLRASLERQAATRAAAADFAQALRGPTVAVIAEIKRSSPSKGELNRDLAAGDRAAAYVAGGAAAISVLTEPTRFSGSLEDLREVAESVRVPVLRKDFILDGVQILEARAAGAAAVLLIARAVEPRKLVTLTRFALAHGVEPLVEVRTVDELDRAADAGARVVGVNARDLETLEVSETLAPELIGRVPADLVAVAESGIRNRSSVEELARAGADAVLVGSALSVASDPHRAVADLAGVTRVGRRG